MASLLGSCAYLPLAALGFWPVWVHWSSNMNGCNCWDQIQQEWFVQWVASAFSHGHSVLTTNHIYVPGGINLMWNASVIALGTIFAPLTQTIGIVHTFSILLTLSLALSASAMFALLRRWTTWTLAAWLGGLVYGFSTLAMVETSQGRLNLVFDAVLPLIVIVLDKLIRKEWTPRAAGVVLGLLLTLQLFISEEILLIFGALTGVMLLGLALIHRREVWQQRVAAITSVVAAGITFLLLSGYPLYVEFRGPARITGPPQSRAQLATFSSDGLSLITPGSPQWLTPGWADQVYAHFSAALSSEVTTYVGVPLLLFVLITAVVLRRATLIRIFALTTAIAFLCSMGPQLLFDGHKTGLRLPGDILAHLPILGDIIPSRYAVGMWFGIAVIFAIGLERARTWARERWGPGAGGGSTRRSARHAPTTGRFWPGLLVAALGIAVLLPLVPDWPFAQVPADVPSFFTNGDVRVVPPESIAVTYPYPLTATAWPMVWQADTDMRYRMLGGYAIGPDENGAGTYFSSPNAIEYCLLYVYTSASTRYCDPSQLRDTLRKLHVTSVIADNGEPHANLARSVLVATLGARPRRLGGVSLWRCVPRSPHHPCVWN